MKLIDSNIIIYSPYPNYAYLRPLVMDASNFVSAVSMVEVLGFPQLKPADKQFYESVFQVLQILPLDDAVLKKAIDLRQQQKIKLADSLIAATALLRNLEVQTRNVADFRKIPGLRFFNPIP